MHVDAALTIEFFKHRAKKKLLKNIKLKIHKGWVEEGIVFSCAVFDDLVGAKIGWIVHGKSTCVFLRCRGL